MPHLLTPALAAAMLAMAALPGHAASRDADPLTAYRDKARVLVVLAPDAADPRLAKQRKLFQAMKAEAVERDLALLEAIGNEPRAAALRERLGLAPHGFHAVLVGKDGGAKLTADAPLGRDELVPLIDSMPMRQREMRRETARCLPASVSALPALCSK